MRTTKLFVGHLGGGEILPLHILQDREFEKLLKRYGKDFYIVYNPQTGFWSIYQINFLTHEVSPMIYLCDSDEFGYTYVQSILQEAKYHTDRIRGKIAKYLDMAEKYKRDKQQEEREIKKEELIKELEKPQRLVI